MADGVGGGSPSFYRAMLRCGTPSQKKRARKPGPFDACLGDYWRLAPESMEATWVTTLPSTTGRRSPAGFSAIRTVCSLPS